MLMGAVLNISTICATPPWNLHIELWRYECVTIYQENVPIHLTLGFHSICGIYWTSLPLFHDLSIYSWVVSEPTLRHKVFLFTLPQPVGLIAHGIPLQAILGLIENIWREIFKSWRWKTSKGSFVMPGDMGLQMDLQGMNIENILRMKT